MAVNANKSCDKCGTIVYGTDRGAFVRKTNIFINGQVGKNNVDEETGWKEVVYMTRTAQDQLAFCNATCLVEWLELQEEVWFNRKRARLMAEAEVDQRIRLEHSFDASKSSGDRPGYKKYRTPPANAPAPAPAPGPKHIGYGGDITEPKP